MATPYKAVSSGIFLKFSHPKFLTHCDSYTAQHFCFIREKITVLDGDVTQPYGGITERRGTSFEARLTQLSMQAASLTVQSTAR